MSTKLSAPTAYLATRILSAKSYVVTDGAVWFRATSADLVHANVQALKRASVPTYEAPLLAELISALEAELAAVGFVPPAPAVVRTVAPAPVVVTAPAPVPVVGRYARTWHPCGYPGCRPGNCDDCGGRGAYEVA